MNAPTLVAVLFLGCAASACAQKAIVYALDSNTIAYSDKFPNPDPSRSKFHGWFIDKTYPEVPGEFVASFLTIVDAEKSYDRESQVMCFQPGFGISITRDGKIYDYVICFHCHNMDVYIDNEQKEDEVTIQDDALKTLEKLKDRILPQPESANPAMEANGG